uniref:Uncharacterized protein n=1 Tax=Ascaris lumbricoides TaxID=6252 RepID=A0A0M3HQP0_ASCLU
MRWDSLDLAFIPIHQDLDIERVFPSHWSAEAMSSGMGLGVRIPAAMLRAGRRRRESFQQQITPFQTNTQQYSCSETELDNKCASNAEAISSITVQMRVA